jgi:DNA invertase Pin-like site-specific DNA recombinase
MTRYPTATVGNVEEQKNAIAIFRYFKVPYPLIAELLGVSLTTVYRRIKI